jgi:2-polyprenyl-3-methyl-5-hydroxy-6-metoxy-1,4-benzoquinol methylase
MINTKYRTDEPEIMDDFNMEGLILQNALDKIASINQLLGGNSVTLEGVTQLLKEYPKQQKITIIDVGCGNGDMLRYLANYAQKNHLIFDLIGIDANNFTINHAKNLSLNYSNISYSCEDIFHENFKSKKFDIALCTLTLHHFKDEEIINLMQLFYDNSSIGIVVNDLHRSKLAYRLFQGLCFVFRLNYMSRQDGLISILRGFKKVELQNYSKQLKFTKYTIAWRWAFRFQWIIKKN